MPCACDRENRKAQGKIDDDEELDDGKSFASFVSGMSNTSLKLRKLDSLADSSLKSYATQQRKSGANMADLNRSTSGLGQATGGALGRLGLRSSSMSASFAKKPSSVKSVDTYNTVVGMKQSQLRAQGVWVPKVRERPNPNPNLSPTPDPYPPTRRLDICPRLMPRGQPPVFFRSCERLRGETLANRTNPIKKDQSAPACVWIQCLHRGRVRTPPRTLAQCAHPVAAVVHTRNMDM